MTDRTDEKRVCVLCGAPHAGDVVLGLAGEGDRYLCGSLFLKASNTFVFASEMCRYVEQLRKHLEYERDQAHAEAMSLHAYVGAR